MQGLIGTKFPDITVQTLSKITYKLPLTDTDKPTILCLVFQQQAQKLVDTWTNPILKLYLGKEILFLEVPMISGGYGLFSGAIDSGMRSGINPLLHDYVATYYGNVIQYKKALNMTINSSCYTFVLDQLGIIKFVSEGASTEKGISKMTTVITKLL
jgi:ATP10 protein